MVLVLRSLPSSAMEERAGLAGLRQGEPEVRRVRHHGLAADSAVPREEIMRQKVDGWLFDAANRSRIELSMRDPLRIGSRVDVFYRSPSDSKEMVVHDCVATSIGGPYRVTLAKV